MAFRDLPIGPTEIPQADRAQEIYLGQYRFHLLLLGVIVRTLPFRRWLCAELSDEYARNDDRATGGRNSPHGHTAATRDLRHYLPGTDVTDRRRLGITLRNRPLKPRGRTSPELRWVLTGRSPTAERKLN